MKPQILLASASPRRREILANLGYHVIQIPAGIDETPLAGENPETYALRMAQQKNRAAATRPGASKTPFVSADTVVAAEGRILGKPFDEAEARVMLELLSDSVHQVLTGVCVSYQGEERSIVQVSDVRFKALSEREIDDYVATGEPSDKAGAYGIQGIGGAFVSHLSGSFTGVMGLPVFETLRLLKECGAPVPPFSKG